MYTVTRRRHTQSGTRYLIGICTSLPNKWMDEMFPDFKRVQISLDEFELTAKLSNFSSTMILEFKHHGENIRFDDITLNKSSKNKL